MQWRCTIRCPSAERAHCSRVCTVQFAHDRRAAAVLAPSSCPWCTLQPGAYTHTHTHTEVHTHIHTFTHTADTAQKRYSRAFATAFANARAYVRPGLICIPTPPIFRFLLRVTLNNKKKSVFVYIIIHNNNTQRVRCRNLNDARAYSVCP